MAKEFRQRPSSFLALEGYEAYCFDQACSAFGWYVQNQLELIRPKEDAKQRSERMRIEALRTAKLNELLGIEDTSRFRDPAANAKRGARG